MMMSEYTDDIVCPHCQSGLGVTRDYAADGCTINSSVPKTVGSLADKHNSQFSDDYKQHLLEKTRGKKKKSKIKEYVEGQNAQSKRG